MPLFVWKGNEAEQKGRLNSQAKERERRCERCGKRGKQRGREEVCVLGLRARTQGLSSPTTGAGEKWRCNRPHRQQKILTNHIFEIASDLKNG